MMGVTHSASGLAVGMAVAPLVGLHGPDVFPFALAAAGAALLPDLDHRSATATTAFGPVSRSIGWVLRTLSRGVYRATATKGIDDADGEHRALTHTVVAAVAAGAIWGTLAWSGGAWTGIGAVFILALLAAVPLGPVVLILVWPLLGAAILVGDVVPLDEIGWWVGIAVALGCVVHSSGDALTRSGAPLLWPIRIRGTRWHRIAPPIGRRLLTNSRIERVVVLPAFVLASFVIAFLHLS